MRALNPTIFMTAVTEPFIWDNDMELVMVTTMWWTSEKIPERST